MSTPLEDTPNCFIFTNNIRISFFHFFSEKKVLFANNYVILQLESNIVFMARIMAIDYGRKRTGLAVTDELQLIATGLATVETPQLMSFLADYCRKEQVERFVVGEAKHMDNTPSESAQYIEPFVDALAKQFPDIPISRIDERFTSKMAFQAMIDGGLRKKQRQNKALIDTVSAVIMLQNFMQLQSNLTPRN